LEKDSLLTQKYLKMINIDELIQSFESKSKNKKKVFNDFVYHCYMVFEDLIKKKKHKRHKDKYNITRQKLINHLIANEKTITMKLCR
jgi:hypothetical protein